MKLHPIPSLIAALLLAAPLRGEVVTLTVQPPAVGEAYSNPLFIADGESAEVISKSSIGTILVNIGGFESEEYLTHGGASGGITQNRVVVAGPATLRVSSYDGQRAFMTVNVTRAGLASPPAAIPIEAGSNFNVVLESSSDLVNWFPANPGAYTGTEPRRFFRVRIVRDPS